ncbi:glycosyltransferase family 4 protein [Algoriphagus winogradskyi]
MPYETHKGLTKKLGLSFLPNSENKKRIDRFLTERNFDKILCRYVSAAKDLPPIDNLIIDIDDDYQELMNSKIKSEKDWARKIRYWQIAKLNTIFYKRVLESAARLILVKPQHLNLPYDILPNMPFQSLLSNDSRSFCKPSGNSILFVGKLTYLPNSDGILWFLKSVWPQLIMTNPTIKLTIVSVTNPDEELAKIIKESVGVTLKINIDNLAFEYREHTICIVPVFYGGGSNVKLSEALYHYRKVVSSTFGARGFEEWNSIGLVRMASTVGEWVLAIEQGLKMENAESDFNSLSDHFSFNHWANTLITILDEA